MENWLTYFLLIGVVLAGGLLVHFLKEKMTGSLKFLLAFSGAFMLGIAALHLIPEVYANHEKNIGLYVLLGFLIQLILEYFSKGIEHGHIHAKKNASSSYFAPLLISLCIHAFVEGLPLANETLGHVHTHSHGFVHDDEHSFLISILLHKFPIAITLMTLFVKSGLGVIKSFLWLFVFALMAPLGNFVALYFMEFFQSHGNMMNKILAVVVGMFLHISTTILFETDESHKFNLAKLLLVLSGGFVAYLVA